MIFKGRRPKNLGVTNGRLADGPKKPNWVCSQTAYESHQVDPLDFSGDPKQAMQQLKARVSAMPRTKLIEEREDYLYFEFSTPLMGYVDDVEFYCDGKQIQLRSASRLGYSDLGANAKRVAAIREAFKT